MGLTNTKWQLKPLTSFKRDKVFKNGPRKICGRQPFFKKLPGPFLNTLSQI